MYLKAIEIQGFKSFPDKTVLTFGSDFTAIVGPNGSGKSNISDAIRWVMGEMSSKALRGTKMEDVIFGGTLKRAQVSFAEVSLILDNSEHTFDNEGTEIMVTRRYYRSGESEYYINRQSARLKDINELFMDTGLGKEGYSNIGQGRIDEILSAKSTDRREIFEEAAGISKYRHRKEETERKLQQTRDNLLRINDKISELELQVNPLREQAEKAKKYLVFRDELRGLEVTVWLSQLEKLSETAKKAEADYASAQFLLEQGKADLDALYERAESLAASLREMDVEAEKIRQKISALDGAAAEEQSQAAVLETKMQGNEANIRRLHQEMDAQEGRSGDLQEQIASHERRLREIEEEKKTLEAELQEQGQIHQLQLLDRIRKTEEIESLRGRQTALAEQAAELRSGLIANDSDTQKLLDRRGEVEKTRTEARTRLESVEQERGTLLENLAGWNNKVSEAKNAISGYELRAQGRIRKRNELDEQVSALKIQRDTLQSRIRMYREMAQGYEGYSKATRIVMQEAGKGNLRHIHGPVSKLIQTKDEYTVAIETALGASMQSIVVDSEQDGKAAINLLRRREGGRATFLPISVIRGRRLSENGLEDEYGFVGVACELVSYEKQYHEIMVNLLGRTVIAEDMDTAIAIAGNHGHRFRIVTLDGQVLNAGGSMTGGSTQKSSGVLTRANELARMERQMGDLEGRLKTASEQLQEAARQAAQAEAEIAGSRNSLREAEDQVLRLTQQEENYDALISTLESAISAAQREIDTVTELMSGGESQRKNLMERSEACDREASALETQILEAQLSLDALNETIAASEQQTHQNEMKRSALDAEAATAVASREQLEVLAKALHGDREERIRLIETYETENRRLSGEIEGHRKKAESLSENSDAVRKDLQDASRRRMEVEAGKTAAEREAQQKNKDLMDMERECARLEQKKTTTAMEEKQILDRLWENYELTNTTAQNARVEIESVSAAQKRIAELKRKMNALGHPNIGAIEEFQRVNERYEYLTGQRDDVQTSERELMKIVGDITTEMTEIFRVEFQKINEYFGQTFTEMFGGGRASLLLEDENDILSCGIEIKVQPPGKQVKTIMLLSGGEKAFVAIALYFAIMKVRPTPFCMLDEIDAALDDRNVARFASYLRNLAGKTQFIVITHRRGTMEAADVLYGVTMQEQGVSRILSVDINQIARELNIT
ncbi:MAG: chromosome segregation protein SMC [Oscillospiraceae bacterium]|nr:chromosome segregation protein SMC [Oscillospiraceae bacterium]